MKSDKYSKECKIKTCDKNFLKKRFNKNTLCCKQTNNVQ